MSHGTAHGAPPDIVARGRDARRVYDNATAQITYREPAEVSRFLDGFSLVEPGLVHISQWRGGGGGPRPPTSSTVSSQRSAAKTNRLWPLRVRPSDTRG
jgi:hypothetical protein